MAFLREQETQAGISEGGSERLEAIYPTETLLASVRSFRSDAGENIFAVKISHQDVFSVNGEPFRVEDLHQVQECLEWAKQLFRMEHYERCLEQELRKRFSLRNRSDG